MTEPSAPAFNQTNNAVVKLRAYGGAAAVTISGPGGDLTSYTVGKGTTQDLRPSATIVGVELGREQFVAWDGVQYHLKPTLASMLADNLEPVGKVSKAQSQLVQRSLLLEQLKEEFLQLVDERDRSRAGLALEKLLNRLFEIFELRPRQPFRVVGEQIDGSFELDGQIYLLESKWERHALPEADLLVFRGKIEGKSTFTRGVFIALNDVSLPARDAITRGKAPSFFVMNGDDLTMILSEAISLTEFLRKRVRLLAEEGRVCVPFTELA